MVENCNVENINKYTMSIRVEGYDVRRGQKKLWMNCVRYEMNEMRINTDKADNMR